MAKTVIPGTQLPHTVNYNTGDLRRRRMDARIEGKGKKRNILNGFSLGTRHTRERLYKTVELRSFGSGRRGQNAIWIIITRSFRHTYFTLSHTRARIYKLKFLCVRAWVSVESNKGILFYIPNGYDVIIINVNAYRSFCQQRVCFLTP